MPEHALQLIVATFADRTGAPRALHAVLRARARVPGGILDVVSVTRSAGDGLLLQGAAEPLRTGGFAVSAAMGRILELLEHGERRPHAAHRAETPLEWKRAARALERPLRPTAVLLTPGSSALLTIVAPAGAGEVVGAVLEEAYKLAVEDLPVSAIAAIADEPAVQYGGADGAAVRQGSMPRPYPAFATYVPAPIIPMTPAMQEPHPPAAA